jgi:oxygen-independent coproporphyrinogen-3 oxidase
MRSKSSSQAVLSEDWQNGGFGLYVHWPFCQAKCPYCDFNSHVSATIDQSAWRLALVSELKRVAALTPGRVLNSIFFGGGTPSLMDPSTVAAIIEKASELWTPANNIEITLEANPTSVEAGRFQGYKTAGVNRISMGIQALDDADLKALGRLHTVSEAKAAFEIARNTFDRVSFDLIYARQNQSLTRWESELSDALRLAIDHLSLYQLTIEDGTAFGDRYKRGALRGLPSDDLSADMFQLTQDITSAAGMPAYEVSNHARADQQSLHNLIYWTYGDYAGIGPGAHGRLTLGGQRHASEAYSNPAKWLELAKRGNADKSVTTVSNEDQATEMLLMGLRLHDGIDTRRFEKLNGKTLDPQTVQDLEDLGMIKVGKHNLSVTNQGLMVLNSIIGKLLTA